MQMNAIKDLPDADPAAIREALFQQGTFQIERAALVGTGLDFAASINQYLVDVSRASVQSRSSALAKLRDLLAKSTLFSFAEGDADAHARQQLDKLVEFATFDAPTLFRGNLLVTAGNKERSQFRLDGEQRKNSLWAHFIIDADFVGAEQVHVALRWLHGNSDEEVIVRMRLAGMVVNQAIELPLNPSSRIFLLSVSRQNGFDLAMLDGVPVYYRQARGSAPTGLALDMIGAGGRPATLRLPMAIVSEAGPAGLSIQDACRPWFHGLLAAVAGSGDIPALYRLLYASQACGPLPESLFKTLLSASLGATTPYRDYVTEALLSRAPQGRSPELLADVYSMEPKPMMEVDSISVDVLEKTSTGVPIRNILTQGKRLRLLHNISLRAYTGDIVGIIGRNGAGKTTFLKTLVGAMPISEGRIAAASTPILLRPGAGMLGELTGRENIYKIGLLMGYLPGEIAAMMEDIIEFSGLRENIDKPFRYYSDGMRARLIFSLATAIPRNILLLDELLGAGDMGFQAKAMQRLDSFIQQSKLVFVVQHTFDFIHNKCTKCLLLADGKPVYLGDPQIATELYRESL